MIMNKHFIHHDGTVRGSFLFNQVCSVKKRAQRVRLTDDPKVLGKIVDDSGKFIDTGEKSQRHALMYAAGYHSKIPNDWEIFKIFFDNNKIEPTWILGSETFEKV